VAIDLMVDDNGDLVIDPDTHDLALVTDADELAQRIRATLDIRFGEMPNLDPTIGADYRNFLGKNLNEAAAAADMQAAITVAVPEVTSVNDIKFKKMSNRGLAVTFWVSYEDPDKMEHKLKGDYTIDY
jgi:hypothetical protein